MTEKVKRDRKQGWDTRCAMLVRHFALGVMPAALLFGQSPASAEALVPKNARVMTAAELYMVFRDKTWKWEDGAGRMQNEGRIFTAWAQSDTGATWAEGRWILNDHGQLCLKAVWHSQEAAASNTACFSHRILDNTIYQKREPAGDWYVFKHARPLADDEFKKLVIEDLVGARLPLMQRLVTTQPKSKIDGVRPETEANELGDTQ
ncbi:DUF995 domain-containing protein [Sinorhizobium garamanticum]|uniref:DUF995 domain-containing protein n=1 Tax=Sinorhizobium garamanticum TaxID=680247 RepID=A0ABY8DI92_9HYPH|nr:DUF995 domain-containing protein [Sinorhizobium garamanticum]WEX90599.1 DUF995 domain-containing protein [Sinorhizobium garamanticum]